MKNMKVVVGRTNRALADQGYTYNQTGFTFNEVGVLYGGIYGGDIFPVAGRSRMIKPSIRMGGDLDTSLNGYIKSLEGLIAYYPLTENTGNALNTAPVTSGSYTGSVSGVTQGVLGQVGKAYTFDSTDKISVSTDATIDGLTAVSVVALVNIAGNGGSGFGRIIAKGPNAVGYWDVNVNSGNSATFNADHATQDLAVRIAITFDEWVCLAFTYNGGSTASSSVNGYINGVEVNHTLDQNGTGGRTSDSSVMAIGNRTTDTARGFDGKMQHIAVFNREITAGEVLRIAQLAGLA